MTFLRLIILALAPSCLFAEDTIPKIEINNLEFKALPESLTTVNEKGESLLLLSAVEIKIHSVRCYDKGFKVNLPIEYKGELNKLIWCRWNPAGKFWQKEESPQLKSNVYSGKPGYSVIVRCPGIYAFLESSVSDEKGLIIESTSNRPIKRIEIHQTEPNMSIIKEYSKAQTKIKIKTANIYYHGIIRITYLEKNQERKVETLAGAVLKLDKPSNDEGYRAIKLKDIISINSKQIKSK